MFIIKLRFYVAKYKVLTKIALFFLGVLLLYSAYEILGNVFSGTDASTIGVYGALLGALIGGAISLGGSIWVHNRQLKSGAELRRKDEIFTPLYNELIILRNRLFDLDKFPPSILVDNDYPKANNAPSYTELIRIKNSSLYLELPEIFKEKMEELIQNVNEYNEDFMVALDTIDNSWRSILKNESIFLDYNEVIFALRVSLEDEAVDYFRDIFSSSDDKKDRELKAKYHQELNSSVRDNAHFSSIKEKYILLENIQKDLIEILEFIIKTTIQKYEK